MRRNGRGMYEDTDNYMAVLWVAGGILLVAIIAFFVVYGIYNSKIEEQQLALSNEDSSKINISNSSSNTTAVSSSIGKNVNEVKNDTTKNEISNQVTNTVSNENTLNTVNGNKVETSSNEIKVETSTETENSNVTTSQSDSEKEENKEEEKEPEFINPIEGGEILREFAKDNLVYSDTLEEWITHLGLDIKAPKTTVVKAAESGTVESIKNDPRYGITVIIKHSNDYKTVYSNLLTAEFVKEGDEVALGQTVGTVGNSAAFEIADEPHLHFEIIKNGEKVDPSLYI